jgi:hypothetical protein
MPSRIRSFAFCAPKAMEATIVRDRLLTRQTVVHTYQPSLKHCFAKCVEFDKHLMSGSVEDRYDLVVVSSFHADLSPTQLCVDGVCTART